MNQLIGPLSIKDILLKIEADKGSIKTFVKEQVDKTFKEDPMKLSSYDLLVKTRALNNLYNVYKKWTSKMKKIAWNNLTEINIYMEAIRITGLELQKLITEKKEIKKILANKEKDKKELEQLRRDMYGTNYGNQYYYEYMMGTS